MRPHGLPARPPGSPPRIVRFSDPPARLSPRPHRAPQRPPADSPHDPYERVDLRQGHSSGPQASRPFLGHVGSGYGYPMAMPNRRATPEPIDPRTPQYGYPTASLGPQASPAPVDPRYYYPGSPRARGSPGPSDPRYGRSYWTPEPDVSTQHANPRYGRPYETLRESTNSRHDLPGTPQDQASPRPVDPRFDRSYETTRPEASFRRADSLSSLPPRSREARVSPEPPPGPPPRRDFIIVGLFALRLAKRLIETLDQYPERDTDLAWITHFLAPYPLDYALAKLSGSLMDNYVDNYPRIVSRFKRQPKYPIKFMQLNPDRRIKDRVLTDQEALDIIDFADAAGEWGSTVPIPHHESERMIALADRRRIAE